MEKIMNGGNQVCKENNKVVANTTSVKHLNLKDMIEVKSIEEVKNAINDACYGYFHFSLGMFGNLNLYSNDKEFLEQLPTEFEIYNEETDTNEVFICENGEHGNIKISRPKDIIEVNLKNIFNNFTSIEAVDEVTFKVKSEYINEIETVLNWMKANTICFSRKGYIDTIVKPNNEEFVVILK